jgi:hypothetical protein
LKNCVVLTKLFNVTFLSLILSFFWNPGSLHFT